MNWLLLSVLVLLALGIGMGLLRGGIMMIYSVVSWIVALLIVSCATPIIASAVISGTDIDERIEERTVVELRKIMQDRGSNAVSDQTAAAEVSTLDLKLPGILVDQLTDTGDLTDLALQSLGVYELIAQNISRMIIHGATFLIVLLITRFALMLIGHSLKIISRLKGIRQINRVVGGALGCLEALLVVWIGFAVVAYGSASGWGQSAVTLIYESKLLALLYENNLIVALAGML